MKSTSLTVKPNLSVVTVVKRVQFSAAHFYYRDNWSDAKNQAMFYACSNRYGHGHNYVLEASVAGIPDALTGMVVNLKELKQWLVEDVVEVFDHKHMNYQIPYFANHIPTLENMGCFIWRTIANRMRLHNGLRLTHLRLVENESLYLECEANVAQEPEPMLMLTRRYDFSASHRLYNPDYSDGKNWDVFGLCNNLNGHGHNYELEVTIAGEVDPETGMLVNIVALDDWVQQQIIHQVDHKHLNLDVPFFNGINPTAEQIAIVFWQRLVPFFTETASFRLHRVRVIESKNNFADYFG